METLTFSGMVDEFVRTQVARIESGLAEKYGGRIAALEADADDLKKAIVSKDIAILALRADIGALIKMVKALQDGTPQEPDDTAPVGPPKEPEPEEPPVIVTPPPSGPGVFFDRDKLRALPTANAAFGSLMDVALKVPVDPKPDLSDQDDQIPAGLFACGMVYARKGYATDVYKKVLYAIRYIVEDLEAYDGRALALARKLPGVVMAADLIDLQALDPALDAKFRAKIKALLTTPCNDGPEDLIHCMEKRPNNWGTWATAAVATVYAYLGNTSGLSVVARVFKGWLGDRESYASFDYGDLAWQADPKRPVGVNPPGAWIEIDGAPRDVDGVIPDDQRRGKFAYPFPKENYVREAQQGAVMTAIILQRNGYPDVWQWGSEALRRSERWLVEACQFPAEGDDRNTPHILKAAYGLTYRLPDATTPAKSYAGADWWAAALPDARTKEG